MSALDVDLKAQHISTEELLYAPGICIQSNIETSQDPFGISQFSVIASCWDRSCGLAIIVGTFIHGLGNYDAMLNDKEIHFGRRIAQFIISDSGYSQVFRSFIVATREARKVFDDTLSVAKCKAQAEVHDSVATAGSASKSVADQGYMLEQGYTPKDSRMNPTFNMTPIVSKPQCNLK